MKKFSFYLTCLSAIISFQSYAQYTHQNLKIQRSERYQTDVNESPEQFDQGYTYKNLRLFPILTNEIFVEEHKDIGKFTLLKDAIETDKIIITETGARNLANAESTPSIVDTTSQPTAIGSNNPNTSGQVNGAQQTNQAAQVQQIQVQQLNNSLGGSGGVDGTVNTLFAHNKSTDTIFIMAGEVVKGGKQDRVIAQDVVLAPGEEVDLSAFCVERSRWTTKDNNKGEFTGYYNVSSMDIRKVVTEEQNQSKVWSTVDEHTTKNGATSDTKTYTNLENSEEYRNQVNEYLDKFQDAFGDDNRIVGVIAVSGDQVIGLDLFATHDLFIDSYQNIIHSYVGHAITKGAEVTISNEAVFAYLDTILKSEEQQNEEIENNGTVYEYKKKKLHIAKY